MTGGGEKGTRVKGHKGWGEGVLLPSGYTCTLSELRERLEWRERRLEEWRRTLVPFVLWLTAVEADESVLLRIFTF